MGDNNNQQIQQLPVFRLDGRKNRMDFINYFPTIAHRFGFSEIIYDRVERPDGQGDGQARARWDRLNGVALEKLKFYVSDKVDTMVTKGQHGLTARQYYLLLDQLFLHTDVEHLRTLEKRLNSCLLRDNEDLFEWAARIDGIYAQFVAAGAAKTDQEMKHRAMSLVGERWESFAHLLGTSNEVSYVQWQTAMLRKEEERAETGTASRQSLADELYGKKRNNAEGALNFPAKATVMHQSWRGSGF